MDRQGLKAGGWGQRSPTPCVSPQRSACSGYIAVADLLSHTASTRSQLIYGHFLSTYVIISDTMKLKLWSIFTPELKLYSVCFNQSVQSSGVMWKKSL